MSEFLLDEYGNQIWYDKKSSERDNFSNINYRVSLLNGDIFYIRLHRENGPAYINVDGTQQYSFKGLCHYADGPAIIWSDGTVHWRLNGVRYSFDIWCKKLHKSEEEINFLKLKWNIL